MNDNLGLLIYTYLLDGCHKKVMNFTHARLLPLKINVHV